MGLDIPDENGKRIKAVQRTFEVIDVIRESSVVRIKDVADELDIPTSTAHSHLKTLESIGYVIQNSDGYQLGLRFLRDGSVARNNHQIYAAAQSEIDELAESTDEVANLGVEEKGQRVIIYQSEGSEAIYDNALVGEFTNMHWTALGKMILAELPEEYVTEIIKHYGLPKATENTITDPDTLFEELEKIRKQGYALEDEERRVGIRSIAIPLIIKNHVKGAISLSGPKERFDADRVEDDLLSSLNDSRNVIEIKTTYE